jgi:hypothetical protein
MKIVSTGRTISTSEYLERKQRARRKRLYILLGSLAALLVALISVLRLPSLQITEVAAAGVPATGADEVEAKAREYLAGSYLWIVPKTNTFLYPKARLERELGREFPRLSAVAVSLEGAHLLKVEGVERKPFALYCNDVCYFLDETGFTFDISPSFSDGVYFTYTTAVPLENPLGRQFLTPAEFESLAAFVAGVRKVGVEPHSLELSETEGTVILATGATIKFSRGADTQALARALESFLASDEIKGEKDFWARLSTLDMRTANKVFYTFK